jgi:hypothetical protein
MKVNLIPESNFGRWSVGLIVMMPILFYIGMLFVDFYNFTPAGKTILKDIVGRPGVALSMLTGFVLGIAAFFLWCCWYNKKEGLFFLVIYIYFLGFFCFAMASCRDFISTLV